MAEGIVLIIAVSIVGMVAWAVAYGFASILRRLR